jgi:hypothetical protein
LSLLLPRPCLPLLLLLLLALLRPTPCLPGWLSRGRPSEDAGQPPPTTRAAPLLPAATHTSSRRAAPTTWCPLVAEGLKISRRLLRLVLLVLLVLLAPCHLGLLVWRLLAAIATSTPAAAAAGLPRWAGICSQG